MADDAASAVAAAAETASNESGKKPPMTHQDSLEDKVCNYLFQLSESSGFSFSFFGQNLTLFLQGSVDSCDTKETSDDDEIDVSEITDEITKQVSH